MRNNLDQAYSAVNRGNPTSAIALALIDIAETLGDKNQPVMIDTQPRVEAIPPGATALKDLELVHFGSWSRLAEIDIMAKRDGVNRVSAVERLVNMALSNGLDDLF